MGTWYRIVNPAKRQYLDPSDLGVDGKNHAFLSHPMGMAVALLVGTFEHDPAPNGPHLLGGWRGDPVVFAADNEKPDPPGIRTATAAEPDRNLYGLAFEEYEDVSLAALALLVDWREHLSSELVALAVSYPTEAPILLANLAELTEHPWRDRLYHREDLERALDAAAPDWRARTTAFRKKYPRR